MYIILYTSTARLVHISACLYKATNKHICLCTVLSSTSTNYTQKASMVGDYLWTTLHSCILCLPTYKWYPITTYLLPDLLVTYVYLLPDQVVDYKYLLPDLVVFYNYLLPDLVVFYNYLLPDLVVHYNYLLPDLLVTYVYLLPDEVVDYVPVVYGAKVPLL